MLVYPKPVRTALKKLLSVNLCIGKLSRKHIMNLLDYSLHGMLPDKIYGDAIKLSVTNVRFFDLDVIRIDDLILAIREFTVIPEELYSTILFHKRYLLENCDIDILKCLIANDLIYKDDIKTLLNNHVVTPTCILYHNYTLACDIMSFTALELGDLLAKIDKTKWLHVISSVSILPAQLIYLSDVLNYPPVNKSLNDIVSYSHCLKLIKKYYEYPLIQYVNEDIKKLREFMYGCVNIIDMMLPKINRKLNEFIYNNFDSNELIKKYGIKSIAMFGINIHINTDIHTLTNVEKSFIEEHIELYDSINRKFSSRFREHIQVCNNRTITMKSGDATNQHDDTHPLVKNIHSQKAMLLDLLLYVDNTHNNIKYKDLYLLMSEFCVYPLACQNILLSSLTLRTKKMAIKIIRKWRVNSLVAKSSYTRIVNGVMFLDIFEYACTRILQEYKTMYSNLFFNDIKTIPPKCNCTDCILSYDPVLKRSLKSNIFKGTKSYLFPCSDITDKSLLNALSDIIMFAIHGYVDLKFSGYSNWGPLLTMIAGVRVLDISIIKQAIENISQANICAGGLQSTDTLVDIRDIKIHKLLHCCITMNPSLVSVIIFFNSIIEYIITLCIYRIHVLGKKSRIREFLNKIIGTILEPFGIYYCAMNINNAVITELLDTNFTVTYMHLFHLILRIILIILENINGNC
ncbi:Virulence [Sea otter poxvirus]|uniref:Virulence n=1 Tax=Sea otter poxvirus TaxID=1416741 RepID=A0A2U9QHL0_9POXV|nr:Virulence [Sea otter poxvirus]AWU47085.1 Virulence [Sea otter poxvirus]